MNANWTVKSDKGKAIGILVHAEDAAALVSLYGDGAKVVYGKGLVVWTQGEAGDGDASESYDCAANTMQERVDAAAKSRKSA